MTTEQAIDTAALDAELAEKLFGWFAPETTDAGSGPWYRCRLTDCFHMHAGQSFATGDGMRMIFEEMRKQSFEVRRAFADEVREILIQPASDGAVVPTAVALAAIAALEDA